MMMNERRGLRRVALAAAMVLAAGMPACVEGPPPVPAEAPPQPQAQPQQQPQQPAQADDGQQPQGDDANVEDFYEPLANYGTWVDTPQYGRVWQPSEDLAGDGFTPYASDGSWAANDDGDWVFESRYDNEFGWATYHYGRWAEHEDYGWVWIPGTVWAPSWVEWRYGGGYVGWVPMGPPGVVVVENRWFFVEERYFTAPVVYGYRLPPERARVAYVSATPIVDVRVGARWTVGPPVARVRASGVAVRTVHTRAPARGYVRTQARASASRGASRPKPAAPRTHGSHKAAPAHHDAPPAHEAPKHHESAKPTEHHAAPQHHEAAPQHHESSKPKAPPPKSSGSKRKK
jgi:hypothetical protein